MKDAETFAERVVFFAATSVGMREKGGPNKGPPAVRFCGGREEKWCGHFVATIYREHGRPLPGDVAPTFTQHNPVARVQTMWESGQAAGWVVDGPPEAGDVVIFCTGDVWHCGIVSAVDGGVVQTIEGNVKDAVSRCTYNLSDWRIRGFLRAPVVC